MAYTLTDQDKQLANRMAEHRLAVDRQNVVAKPKDNGNWFTNSLSTVGGILGGIGGSFFGPGIGTAAGGAAGAGAGKWLENLFEGNKDLGDGVLGEAAFGTLGGVGKGLKAIKGATGALKAGQGVKQAGNILRMGSPMGGQANSIATTLTKPNSKKWLEDTGGRMLASQSSLTAAQARAMGIKPVQAFSNVNKRTGLTKLDDMAEVSRGLTGGKDSMLDMLTREAVGGTNGVNLPDLRKTASNILSDAGMSSIPAAQRKAILAEMTTAGTAVRGGSKGSLSTLANPQAAFDQANIFRGAARDLTSSFNPTGTDKQAAKLYSKIAKTIEDSIYKSPGVNESIPMLTRSGADDLLFKSQDLMTAGNKAQAKAYEKIALELREVKDVAGLRKMKKDFVDIGKIDRATAQADGARSLTGNDMSKRAGEVFRNPMNLLALPLDAATPKIAGAMTSMGRSGSGSSIASMLPKISNAPVKIAATQLGGRAMFGGLPGQGEASAADATLGASSPVDPVTGMPAVESSMGGMDGSSVLGGASPAQSIYTREAVAQDIQRDLQATGGANMDKYITLFNFLNPEGSQGKPNATTQKSLSQSANADATLQQLESMLAQAGGSGGPIGGNISSFFGSLGLNNEAKTYNDLASGSVTQIAKALGETGAMSDADRVAYANLIPRITDTPAVASAKFAALRQRMETAKGNTLQYGAGDGVAEALAAAGY